MSRPRVRRVGQVLRRVADRLDPPRPKAPDGEVKLVSREQLRAIQGQAMRDVQDALGLALRHDPSGGMLWLDAAIIRGIRALVELECEVRDRDFERVERDPTVLR